MSDMKISNVKHEWIGVSKRLKSLGDRFRTINCRFRKFQTVKSEEGVLGITTCFHSKHPCNRNQFSSKCIIELCPM